MSYMVWNKAMLGFNCKYDFQFQKIAQNASIKDSQSPLRIVTSHRLLMLFAVHWIFHSHSMRIFNQISLKLQ